MALRIENGRFVRIAYRILDNSGHVLEERTPENPYEYQQGQGQIVPSVEHALDGKTAGYRTEVSITPREGYGDYDPALVGELKRSNFPNSESLEVGMKFNTVGPHGHTVTLRVTSVGDDLVSVDGNHPLAGLDLVFELQVLGVFEEHPGAMH